MNYSIVRKNGGAIAWTDEQVAYIIKKYTEEFYSLNKLAEEFNCSAGTIRNLLRRKRIPLQGIKRGYPRREDYFSKINSAEKAYWLGFLYADGCVHTNDNTVSLNSTDLEQIEKFKQAIGAINHKIAVVDDTRFKNAKTIYQFAIRDKQLHQDLIDLGCIPQKSLSLEKIPNIPRDFTSHFIRGYFDGDGSLHFLNNQRNFRVSFSGTEAFLTDIKKELEVQQLSIQKTPSKIHMLQICGHKQVLRILSYLYKDSTEETRLDRKYNLYLKCSERVHYH